MDASFWLGFLGIVVTLAIAIGGFTLRTLNKGIDRANDRADGAHKDLQDYKLEAAEKFASTGYLKDVENRIIAAITEVKKDFGEFLREYHRNRPGE